MAFEQAPREGWQPRLRRVLASLNVHDRGARMPVTEPDPARLDALARYLDWVTEWNQRHDLTAARDHDEFVDLFSADALVLRAASQQAQPVEELRAAGQQAQPTEEPCRWVDIGSGAGAPGLPLAILCPELNIELVEPRAKRIAFLRTVVGGLGLESVQIRRARSDACAAQSFAVAVSRATFAPAEWLREGARLATREVWVLLAQGEPPNLPGWQVDLDLEYAWPLTGVRRRALRLRRQSERGSSFPTAEPSVPEHTSAAQQE